MSVNDIELWKDDVLTSPQTITSDWIDVGDEVECFRCTKVGVWLDIDINDSQNIQVRALAKLEKGAAAEYSLPILKVSAEAVMIQQQYFEIDDDIDQKIFFELETGGQIPYVQFQVQSQIEGAPKAILNSLTVTKRWR